MERKTWRKMGNLASIISIDAPEKNTVMLLENDLNQYVADKHFITF